MTSAGPAGKASHGLDGEWLSGEELAEIDFFKGSKRAYHIKLNTNLGAVPGQREPGIKAVVRREYQKGETICKAGAYGSTAFLLLEGTATASLPAQFAAAAVPGRSAASRRWLQSLFGRRSRLPRRNEPNPADIGEVSRYATLSCDNPPVAQTLGPGDFFGIDTCINFYPREATVVAASRCLVLEFLRSVLDSIRDAGDGGGRIDDAYRLGAVRSQLYLSSLFRSLSAEELEDVAADAQLLTPDSDQVRNNVVYAEGEPADALYVIRAGTIKLSQQKAGGEVILTYLGRGAAFGCEGILPNRPTTAWRLECTSHPSLPAVDVDRTLTIGRSHSCEVVLDNRAVGRKHCRIDTRDGDLYLVDLNSANGTLLNGEPIQETLVTVGDRITIVDHTFEIRRAPLPVESAPLRLATATALDTIEIVMVTYQTLRRISERNARFLESATAIARGFDAAATQTSAPEEAFLSEVIDQNLYNSHNVLLIDLDRCTRCDQCVRACASAHDGVARFTRDGPRFGKYLITMACRSCTDPKCMVGCPVGSIRRTDSLEIHIEDWCIGCQRCANQCPFGNINMLELNGPAPLSSAGNDTAAPALRATVCDLCAGYEGPNCVYACPHDAAIRVNPASFLSPTDRLR